MKKIPLSEDKFLRGIIAGIIAGLIKDIPSIVVRIFYGIFSQHIGITQE